MRKSKSRQRKKAVSRESLFTGIARINRTFLAWVASEFPRSPVAAWQRARQTPHPAHRPDSAYTELPADLRRALNAVASRLFLRAALLGLCAVVIVFSILLPLQAAWDWTATLSLHSRAWLLAADGVILLSLLWFFFWRPWRRRPGLEECALIAERHWPQLASALISSVQFSLHPPQPLIRALAEKTSASVAQIRITECVSLRAVWRPAIMAAVLLMANAALFVALMPVSAALLARMALSTNPIPTRTVIASVTGDLKFAAGSTVEILADVSGVLPVVGRLQVTFPGNDVRNLPLASSPSTPHRFSASIPNAQESFSYRVFLGDAASESFSGTVLFPPTLTQISFRQSYPAYTRLAPVDRAPGNLELLAGSKLEIQIEADQPLASARVESGNRPPVPLAVDGSTGRVALDIPAADFEAFSVVLTNAAGVDSANNTQFRVSVIPDEPPTIEITDKWPARRTILPPMRPEITATVRDDFGVSRTELVVVPNGDESRAHRIKLSPAAPVPSLALRAALDQLPKDFPWKPGTSIAYWIEAEDNNSATGPGRIRSAEREFVIVTPEEKRRELEERLRQNAEALDDLSRRQRDLRDEVGNIIPQP